MPVLYFFDLIVKITSLKTSYTASECKKKKKEKRNQINRYSFELL